MLAPLPHDEWLAISPKKTRDAFKPFEGPDDRRAACKVGADVLAYSVLLFSVIHFDWWLKLALAVPGGVMITRLHILAHDACHGSLFSGSRVNRIIGRLCFLASATPYSLWQLGHNTIHHGFTNLKGRDTIWTPLAPEEYACAGRFTRWLARSYRTPWGVGAYYAIELWWNKLFFPSRKHVGVRRREHLVDNFLVASYMCLLVFSVSAVSSSLTAAFVNLIFALILPWMIACWTIGFIIFIHHTHASVRWFRNRREWSFERGQIEGSVHVRFPRWVNLLLHNIYEHTAHHINVKIPCYRLAEAQLFAESCFREHIVVEDFTWKAFLRTMRECQLYDYDNYRWQRFDGTPAHAE